MSIIRLGASMLLGLFLVLVFYFIISTPMEVLFDGFDNADIGDATNDMNSFLPNIRTALSIAFAITIASPIMIFVMRTFEREPDWSYYRRY